MPLNVKPVGFRVLVEALENRKVNNLELPGGAGSAYSRCVVVDIGEAGVMMNGEKCEIPCKVGDEVMFNTGRGINCGPPHLFGGRSLYIVEADAILGIMSGEADAAPPAIVTAKRKLPAGVLTH